MFSAILESDCISIINNVNGIKSWPVKVSFNVIEENFGRGKVVEIKNKDIVVCEKGKISVKDIFLNIYERNYFGKNEIQQLTINKNEVYTFSTKQDYRECLIITRQKTDGEIARTTSICIPRIELEKKLNLDYCGKIDFICFWSIDQAYLDFGNSLVSAEDILELYFPERTLDKKKIERDINIDIVIPTIPDVAKITLEKFDEIIAWEFDRVLVYITVHGKVFAVENPERFVEHPYFEKDDYLISQLMAVERKNRIGRIYLPLKKEGDLISLLSPEQYPIHNLNIKNSLYTIEKNDFITYIFNGEPYPVLAKFSF
jgi:hypothetical protein